MADLEAVLADVSYLMAMEKSKCTPAARNNGFTLILLSYYSQINNVEFYHHCFAFAGKALVYQV